MRFGERARDPEGLDGEKPLPVPLQAVALVLDQARVDDRPFGTDVGDAEKVTVGRTCPEADSGQTITPSLIAATSDFRSMTSSPET